MSCEPEPRIAPSKIIQLTEFKMRLTYCTKINYYMIQDKVAGANKSSVNDNVNV